MRFTPLILTASLLVPAAAVAQQTVPPPGQSPQTAPPAPSIRSTVGEIQFGGRFTSVDGDAARYQRLRDLRTGPTADLFHYSREMPAWIFQADADHIGYRDQHYAGIFERYGKVKASFDWNQIPLFISNVTQTPYTEESPGVFRLNDAIQGAVQAGGSTQAYLLDIRRFETRSRRDTADARFQYSLTTAIDATVGVKSTHREGSQPWGASFGFSDDVELAAPIDHRTNDIAAALEWSSQKGMARVAYDGSFFTNNVPTLVWDNPLKLTDAAVSQGPAQGRMALWPDSTAHTVSASGAINLPAHSRGLAYVSFGSWLQDQALLPFTINSAVPAIPLSRQSAEAKANITAMTYRFTSRPTPTVWFNAQYRLYDYDNKTPPFLFTQSVTLDGAVASSPTGSSEPFGYKRHFGDFDVSYTPYRYVAFRAGYGVERDHRTYRYVETTTDHTLRASVDTAGLAWGMVRLQYEHGNRTGKGLDEEVFGDIGEQISLRQFDISDRKRDRLSAIVQYMPTSMIGVNGSVIVGKENRPDAAFGLQDNDMHGVTIGADVTPGDTVVLSLNYAFENYSSLQRSRQANPGDQFNDPTRDWSTDMNEDVHTVTASLEVPKLTSKSSLRFGFDAIRSNPQYLYVLPANSTLVPPQQLPELNYRLTRASADFRQQLVQNLGLGVGYMFEQYHVNDFAFSPATLSSPIIPSYVNLTYTFRPYDAHTGYVRLFYTW